MFRLALSALVPVLAFGVVAACGAGDVNPPPLLVADGGVSDAPSADAPPGAVVQTGTIVDLTSSKPVPGAKVTSGAQTATSDEKGQYQMTLDPGVTFSMKVEKTGFYTLQEQELKPAASFNLGKTKFPSENTVGLLVGTFQGYDGAGGIVSIAIEKSLVPSDCADEGGATFDFTFDGQPGFAADGGPNGTPRMIYFSDGFPDANRTSAQTGSFPHAAIYNLPPGKAVVVTGKHPTCKLRPFPVDKDLTQETGSGKATYVSATLSPFGGKSTGFVRLFFSN